MASEALVVDISQDWLTACDVQERFMQMPQTAIQTLTYSAQCRQVRALGGDCFDFLPLSGNRVALAVGDASGKGLPAALMIANVQSSLRTAAHFAPDPDTVISAVNRQVYSSSSAERYATLFYGVFDSLTRTLHYVNAGHNSPIVIRDGHVVAQLEPTGLPIGIFVDSVYEPGVVQLRSGDLIVAYTDGVVEARNAAGEDWGTEGLFNALEAVDGYSPNEIVDAIFASLEEFSGGRQTDDATVAIAFVE